MNLTIFFKLRALFLTIALLAISWLFFLPYYNTNDDIGMKLIVEGKFSPETSSSGLTMFSNIILGNILAFLNRTIPIVSWYDILILGVPILSCVAVLSVLWSRKKLIFFISIILFSLFYILRIFVIIQFSITAMVAAGTGIFLIIYSVIRPKNKSNFKFTILIGVAFIIIGTLVRLEAAIVAIAYGLLLGLPLILLSFSQKNLEKRRVVYGIAAIGISLLLSVAAFKLHFKVYSVTNGWENFYEYNFMRSTLDEFSSYDTAEVPDKILKAANWSQNDFQLLKNWLFIDSNTFSHERLTSAFNESIFFDLRSKFFWRSVIGAIKRTIRLLVFYLPTHLFITLCLCATFFNRKNFFYFIYSNTLLILILISIDILTKPVPYRIYFPLLFLNSIFLFLFIVSQTYILSQNIKWRIIFIIPLIAVILINLADLHSDDLKMYNRQGMVQNDVDKMLAISPSKIVIHGRFFPHTVFYRPFLRNNYIKKMEKIPTLWLGTANSTPFIQDYLKNQGYSDINSLLCNDPKSILITKKKYLKLLETEMKEHYGIDIKYEQAFRGDSFSGYTCRLSS